MKATEAVLLLSGGIDSTTLLAQLTAEGKKVHALSFDYGQRHAVELEFARRNASKYKVCEHHIISLDLKAIDKSSALFVNGPVPNTYRSKPWPDEPTSNYVPGRNLMMLSYAAAYAEANNLSEINFAANADDGNCFPDCSPRFLQALSEVWRCSENTQWLHVRAPFLSMRKSQVIQLSHQLGVILDDTLSCYAPVGTYSCGECFSCIKRKESMSEAFD